MGDDDGGGGGPDDGRGPPNGCGGGGGGGCGGLVVLVGLAVAAALAWKGCGGLVTGPRSDLLEKNVGYVQNAYGSNTQGAYN